MSIDDGQRRPGGSMAAFELRNQYFDRLFSTPGLRWMGQNTNHHPLPAAVTEAMIDCIRDDGFRAYAPPLGFEELRALIVADVGRPGRLRPEPISRSRWKRPGLPGVSVAVRPAEGDRGGRTHRRAGTPGSPARRAR